jgi:excisionase family DNA binding protein
MIIRDPGVLARLLAEQGVTYRQLAEAAGWQAHSHVGRLLSGKARAVSDASAELIAEHLGVALEELFMPSDSSSTGTVIAPDGLKHYTTKQAAAILAVSYGWLRREAQAGRVPCRRRGTRLVRFSEDDIREISESMAAPVTAGPMRKPA